MEVYGIQRYMVHTNSQTDCNIVISYCSIQAGVIYLGEYDIIYFVISQYSIYGIKSRLCIARHSQWQSSLTLAVALLWASPRHRRDNCSLFFYGTQMLSICLRSPDAVYAWWGDEHWTVNRAFWRFIPLICDGFVGEELYFPGHSLAHIHVE